MQDEPNTPDDGIDNVEPQAADTAEDWNYYDPDEDNVEEPEPEATDDGATEAEEATEAEPEEAPEIEAPANAVITLEDGSKVKVQDLIQGNLRQQDYTRKTQEVADYRKSLETQVQRLEGVTEAFIDKMASFVPAAPPDSLYYTNKDAYRDQKDAHDIGMKAVQEIIELGSTPKEISAELTKRDDAEHIKREREQLFSWKPELADAGKQKQFFSEVAAAARVLGYSSEELSAVTDHRIYKMAYYTNLGMKAEQARAVAAQKVAKAPPVAAKRPGQGAVPANRNAEAKKRFDRNPTVKNAAALGWDD